MSRDELRQVARRLAERNAIDAEIAGLLSRPVTLGHVGEWIASHVFGIDLSPSANNPAFDGRFQ